MHRVGCHLSSAKGFLAMGREAVSIGADTFQFFLRNPRGGSAKAICFDDAQALTAFMAEHEIPVCLAHAPYTLNACALKDDVREFAGMVLEDDLKRLQQLPCRFYNLHPGSHVGQGVARGMELTASTLRSVLSADVASTLLLETMAGQGSEIGSTFEQLREILDQVSAPDRIGVCLDTCHVFCAGYDIRNDLDGVLTAFDRSIGLSNLKFVHLNDSKFPCGSHRDRHEKLGCGELGWDAILRIWHHEALDGIPFCLETPQETMDGYAEEIRCLRESSAH